MPRSNPLPSTTKIATNLLFASALAVIACCLFATPTYAYNPLPLGTLTTVRGPYLCGPAWYSYGGTNPPTKKNCQDAVVACPNTANLSVTFGYLDPAGIVNPPKLTQGTITYFTGDTGTNPGNNDYIDYYFRQNYEVVELAWLDDWEMTYDPFETGNGASIQNAACRPATLLNYVYTNIFPSVFTTNPNAGVCAQGQSAGSAAVAYSLAYYGAASYLDNVELLSGPVFSDIGQGCQQGPSANPVTVCGQTNYNGGQYHCQLGQGGASWTLSPTYLMGANTQVQKWTNDATCAAGSQTSQNSNNAWEAQSIVDQPPGALPTFTYSNMGMTGWLCRSVQNNGITPYPCAYYNNNNFNYCPNNSSPQGQIFYANIGASNPPANYALYAVDQCVDAEGVVAGTVPGYNPAGSNFNGTIQGFYAIQYDMAGYTSTNPPFTIPAQCTHR